MNDVVGRSSSLSVRKPWFCLVLTCSVMMVLSGLQFPYPCNRVLLPLHCTNAAAHAGLALDYCSIQNAPLQERQGDP